MLMMASISLCVTMLSPNSADLYRELISWQEEMPSDQHEELTWLTTCLDAGIPATPEMEARWRAHTKQPIDLARSASAGDSPDFEHDFKENGFQELVPELSPMMRGSKLLLAAARWEASQGAIEPAIEHIKAASRIGEHIATDKLIINAVVAQSVAGHVVQSIHHLLDCSTLTEAQRQTLHQSLERYLTQDPFNVAASMRFEAEIATWSITKHLQLDALPADDAPPQDLMEQFFGVDGLGLDAKPPPELTIGSIRKDLQKLQVAYGQLATLAQSPNQAASITAIKALEQAASEGSHGFFATLLLPAISHVIKKRNECVEDIRDCQIRLTSIMSSRGTGNAAWKWIEAGQLAMQANGPWVDDESATTGIQELLAQAGAMQTASYPEPLNEYLMAIVPWWLPGQEALLNGLFVMLDRSTEAGDAATTDRTLQQLIRIAAALADHPNIASSLLSASITMRLAAPVQAYAKHHLTDPGARSDFDRLLRQLPLRDPAGLQRATAWTREHLSYTGTGWTESDDVVVADLSDGALLNLAAWRRGRSLQRQSPRQFLVPQGDPELLRFTPIDGAMLNSWTELGSDEDTSIAFDELGSIPLQEFGDRTAKSIQEMRSILR